MNARTHSDPAQGTSLTARFDGDRAPASLRVGAPNRTARPGESLMMAHAPHDSRAEEIRALRTEILLRHVPHNGAEAIALLSPCAGEGRSQLAAELAIAFAQLGRPTLLVDADLRHPLQHVLFDTDNRQGLCQAIENGVIPHLHAVENLPSMFLVTAGAISRNPLELLLHRGFAALVEDWRRSFEFVVFDTAPLTPYSDALAVANVAGRVLALSRAQHTPYSDTRAMFCRLTATRSQILGAVISHF